MQDRLRELFWTAGQYALTAAVILFIMAAGAASYHQYLAQNRMLRERQQARQVETMQEVRQEAPEQMVYIMTPEDIEEEKKTDELELLAICVEAEAGNQDLTGKRMVADVILNRVDDPDFPDTIEGVITQPYHFSSYWDGGMDRVREPSQDAIRAVQMELENRSYPGLLFFTAGDWPKYGTPWKKVGDHYFNTK